jgi:hypothetical protein
MSLVFELGPTSATAVTITPTPEYGAPKQQVRSQTRTRNGRLFVHKFGSFERFNIPLEFVPASVQTLVASWWDTNTNLLLFITSDSVTEIHSVMLLNQEQPLNTFQNPYTDLYQGSLILEGV